MLFFDDRALNIRVPMIFFQVGNELGRDVFFRAKKVSTSLLGCKTAIDEDSPNMTSAKLR